MLPALWRSNGGSLATERLYPLEQFRREFDTLFDRFFGGFPVPFDPEFGQMRWWDFGVEDQGNEGVVTDAPAVLTSSGPPGASPSQGGRSRLCQAEEGGERWPTRRSSRASTTPPARSWTGNTTSFTRNPTPTNSPRRRSSGRRRSR